MTIFDGTNLADRIASQIKLEVDNMDTQPTLAIFAVAPNKQSKIYIEAKSKRASTIGIRTELHEFKTISTKQLIAKIHQVADESATTGIIVQLPLPTSINTAQVIEAIPRQKDVDGMRFLTVSDPLFAPATSLAVLAALELSPAKPNDSKVVVIGQGEVGKPLTQILRNYQIDVTSVAKPTQKLHTITQKADVIISAVGKPHIITADMIRDNVVLIDVGVSIVRGKTQGDIDFDNCKKKVQFITPPIGGIGPLTIVMLLQNVVRASQIQA